MANNRSNWVLAIINGDKENDENNESHLRGPKGDQIDPEVDGILSVAVNVFFY